MAQNGINLSDILGPVGEIVIAVLGYLLNRSVTALDEELKRLRAALHDTREKVHALDLKISIIGTRQEDEMTRKS